MRAARLMDLGFMPYRDVWNLQRQLHAAVSSGAQPETWIVVEHPPVVTLGRKSNPANLLLDADAFAARGIDVVQIERGGDVTYHGPGQLVVYPIRRLERFREIAPLVRSLEGAVIDACASFGVTGERWSEHAGVWVGNNQICAVGLAVQKMTTLHGIALNVCGELSYAQLIHPCGLQDRGVTSLIREGGRTVTIADAKAALIPQLEAQFDVRFKEPALAS